MSIQHLTYCKYQSLTVSPSLAFPLRTVPPLVSLLFTLPPAIVHTPHSQSIQPHHAFPHASLNSYPPVSGTPSQALHQLLPNVINHQNVPLVPYSHPPFPTASSLSPLQSHLNISLQSHLNISLWSQPQSKIPTHSSKFLLAMVEAASNARLATLELMSSVTAALVSSSVLGSYKEVFILPGKKM